MEKKTIGSFLSAMRKASGMTQQEVADRLNISNKTVSKWERDEGCPEIMMLPAIAELYSVTVDEILRGERIIKPESEDKRNVKSEARVKLIIDRSTVKFTNCSIVSVLLGVVAFLLSYTVVDIIRYNYLWIAYVAILVLVSSSLAVMLIAFNNFSSGIKNASEVQKENYEAALRKSIKYISAVVFFTVATLTGLIAWIAFDGPDFMFVVMAVAVAVSIAVTFYVRSLLYKKYSLEEVGLSPAGQKYRKKHVKKTVVMLAVVLILSLVLPFICVFTESSVHTAYCFIDDVGYQYESQQEAEREYRKLKAYVTGEKTLYRINDEDYSEDTMEYVLYAEPLYNCFEQTAEGFNKVGTELADDEELSFKSFEEVEDFKSENEMSDELEYLSEQRNIIFDDEAFSVSYQLQDEGFIAGVIDVMPVFLVIGSCGFAAVLIMSVLIYYINKKKIQ